MSAHIVTGFWSQWRAGYMPFWSFRRSWSGSWQLRVGPFGLWRHGILCGCRKCEPW